MSNVGRCLKLLGFLGILAIAGSCSDDKTTVINQGGGALLIGEFPGDQAGEHFVADDGRAFNHRGAKINKGLQVFWNAANGHAIVIYLDEFERLWVHHWNGTSFTPGVELVAPAQERIDDPSTDDDLEVFGNYRVLFLNTAGHANANASARNGDALICWIREDEEPSDGDTTGNGLDPDADQNYRLYGTYFDVSARGTPLGTNPNIHYGFNTRAVAMDFDNKRAGETDDDDVESFGFVSDSLRFTHAIGEYDESDNHEFPFQEIRDGSDLGIPPAVRSGDPTNYAFVVWSKARNDVTVLAGNGVEPARRWHWLEFDLTQVGNAMPVQAANGDNTITAGDIMLQPGSAVDTEAIVHNGCMIWEGTADNGAQGLFLSCFTAGSGPATIELSRSVRDSAAVGATIWSGTNPDMPSMHNVYGGDHGLTSLYAVFETFNGTEHIACAKVDLDAPFDQDAQEIEPIEAQNGGSIEDLDGTRISRNGDWFLVVWRQNNQVSMSEQLAGITATYNQVYTNCIQTRTTATARTMANSHSGAAPVPNSTQDTNDPNEIFFQSEIAEGTQDPRCGFQSNTNRINFCWHETTGNLASLKFNGNTITLSTDPAAAPTCVFAVTDSAGGVVGQTDNRYEPYDQDNGMHPVLTDLGTADGAPLCYFLTNANNPTDSLAAGAFDEIRVHGNPCLATVTPAGAQVVSTDAEDQQKAISDNLTQDSDDDFDDFEEDGGAFLRVRTTPYSMNPGNHSGTRTHLFMRESHNSFTSTQINLVTRYFNKAAFSAASAAATFVTAHVPALTADPMGLLGPSNDSVFIRPVNYEDNEDIGPKTAFVTSTGDMVGIYYTSGTAQARHFYYQEFNGTSWMTRDGGVPNPQIIDNIAATSLFFGRDQQAYAFPPQNMNLDTLNGVLTFWSAPVGDIGLRRWFVRSRN